MKKTLAIIALALITSTILISCKDGICDTCKEKDAVELTKEQIQELKDNGIDKYIDVDKEWCEACFIKEAAIAAKQVLGDALSGIGDALGLCN